jgi:ribulose kinase
MDEFQNNLFRKTQKSNCSNTLKNFFKAEEECVSKLEFFDENNVDKSYFLNIQMLSNRKKEINKKDENNIIRLINPKNSSFK